MERSAHPFALSVVSAAVLAAGLLSSGSTAVHAEQAARADEAAEPGRHIAVWDPPPFSIRSELARGTQGSSGAEECPPFVFQSSFEPGYLDGIFRTGLELPPESAGSPIQFTTAAGFIVRVDKHTISIQDPFEMNKVEHWGDPHENLNGKHIKDWAGMAGWDGARRTMLMNGGAKVTMESAGPQGVTLLTSIYDGQQNLQIDNTTNAILHHGFDAVDTAAREAAQYDGETARFTIDTATAMAEYKNVYNEDATFTVVPFDVLLGTTGGCANPRQTHDYFDDPRLPNT